jgi:hypothetical protein
MKGFLSVRYAVLLLLLASAIPACALMAAFEVASVRPNASNGGGSSIRVTAGPDWLTSEHFNIDAEFPADTPLPKVRAMMQALPADRFRLILHKETRLLPMYSLVVATNGPKVHLVPLEAGGSRTTGKRGSLKLRRSRCRNQPICRHGKRDRR